ncbi:MAG: phosphomethylpyrimidine synthase ThiC, partial [Planctomycetes bacterium]|nr:phosphomethylpyrimidine synthase ThiC [Planctomycetota bacterium]
TAESFMRTLREHGENGVDFVTIHAGVQREAIPLARKRGMGVVSRGGSFMVRWMETKGQESFLYENFDEILGIAGEYGMTLSLGDGLRPGCIGDATDEAQLHELHVLGELAERAVKAEVQVMIEGPGHVPLKDIERNVQLEKDICDGAPFYVLGPLPTDIAPGYDHIVGSIGGAIAASAGADFLCYLTPKEHVGLPDARDVREGVVVTRIAAHIGDITKGISGAEELDRKMSEARTGRDWDEMARHALDSVQFQRLLSAEDRGDQCSMCGQYCALKIFSGDDAR